MYEPINDFLFAYHRLILARDIHDKSDYYSDDGYIHELEYWHNMCFKKDVAVYDSLKESQFSSSIDNPNVLKDIKHVVYVMTHQKRIIYVGCTERSFSDRYRVNKTTRLVQRYENLIAKPDEIFIKHVEGSRYELGKLEAGLMNLISTYGIPLCNIMCENLYQHRKLDALWTDNHRRMNFTKFARTYWNKFYNIF